MSLGERVRQLRKERKWSQEMTAHFADLHPTEVSRVERNLRQVRLITAQKLANAFHMTLCEFLEGVEVT